VIFTARSPPAAAGYIHVPDLRLGIGHPVTTRVASIEKCDFHCSLATCGGGVHPCTRSQTRDRTSCHDPSGEHRKVRLSLLARATATIRHNRSLGRAEYIARVGVLWVESVGESIEVRPMTTFPVPRSRSRFPQRGHCWPPEFHSTLSEGPYFAAPSPWTPHTWAPADRKGSAMRARQRACAN
jgi:hypothetical protein